MSVAAAPKTGTEADASTRALSILHEHADHSSAFLTFNEGTQHYVTPQVEGLIAYRTAGRRHVVQLCGVLAEAEDRSRLLAAFRAGARSQGRRITAVQLQRDDAEMYAGAGFSVDQFGASYSIDLDGYALRGQRFVKTRNMISRARREGVVVEQLAHDEQDSYDAELGRIDTEWLGSKGRHVQELAFMVGERGGRGARYRRTFVARHEGRAVGYVSYSPCFGSRPGWLYDLTRRTPDAPPGTIELIFYTALEQFRDEGWGWLHLGLTPFAGLDPAHAVNGSSRVSRFAVGQLAERGEKLYPARTQQAFKLKWHPQVITPEYVAFEGGPSLGAVWQLLRLTRTIP